MGRTARLPGKRSRVARSSLLRSAVLWWTDRKSRSPWANKAALLSGLEAQPMIRTQSAGAVTDSIPPQAPWSAVACYRFRSASLLGALLCKRSPSFSGAPFCLVIEPFARPAGPWLARRLHLPCLANNDISQSAKCGSKLPTGEGPSEAWRRKPANPGAFIFASSRS
jgi:hypothetical protein